MYILDPGHEFLLDNLDVTGEYSYVQTLYFVKRCGPGYPGNVGCHSGTTVQEVLRAVIARLKYCDNQIQHHANSVAIEGARRGIFALEARAAERHRRSLDTLGLKQVATDAYGAPMYDVGNIEDLPVCAECGHIGCAGTCHDGLRVKGDPQHG